jgi:hypothetical protein
MNDWDNPLKKEVPESDYKSIPETKSKESDDSSIERDLPKQIQKRNPFIPPSNPKMEDLKTLAAQMEEMQRQFSEQLRNQNELIQNQSQELSNLHTHTANHPHNPNHPVQLSNAENVLKQFIKLPIKMFNDENPKKPNLAFNGSNISDWGKAIYCTLVNAFDREGLFIKNLDNFSKLNRPKNQAVASLIRNLLDPALLTIVESGANNKPRDLFVLLRKKCKCSGRCHKLMAIEKLLLLASKRPPASKSWLASWCNLKADLDCANPALDEVW